MSNEIEASGVRLGRIVFVAAADCYMGQAITVVQPNARIEPGRCE